MTVCGRTGSMDPSRSNVRLRASLLDRRSRRWLLSNSNSDRAADNRGYSNDWHEA